MARDQNHVQPVLFVSSVDGSAISPYVNPVTGRLLLSVSNSAVTPTVGDRLTRDQNHVPVAGCVSSADDSVIIPPAVSPDGHLFITN